MVELPPPKDKVEGLFRELYYADLYCYKMGMKDDSICLIYENCQGDMNKLKPIYKKWNVKVHVSVPDSEKLGKYGLLSEQIPDWDFLSKHGQFIELTF